MIILIKKHVEKVLVKLNETHPLPFFITSLFLFSLDPVQVRSLDPAQVRLDLHHQCRDGNERAAQRLRCQQVPQLFRLGRVNARVLCRVRLLLFHCFHPVGEWSATTNFRIQRFYPYELVAGVFILAGHGGGVRLVAHDAQLRVSGSRRHHDGNHEAFDCFIAAVGRVGGGTVGGTGL
jgi:hypothetical protein